MFTRVPSFGSTRAFSRTPVWLRWLPDLRVRRPKYTGRSNLRSAPLPAGVTESIDLDLGELRRAGVTRLLAACGLMGRMDTGGQGDGPLGGAPAV